MKATEDVLIVGGGIAGMVAAITLTEHGFPVCLLERNPYSLGGRIAGYPPFGFEYQGRQWSFSMEHGIHGWWRQYRNFLAFLERHGRSDQLIAAYDQVMVFLAGEEAYLTNVGRETQITPVPEPLHHVQLLAKKNVRRLLKSDELPEMFTLGLKIFELLAFDPRDPADRARYDALSVADFTRDIPFFFRAFLQSLTRSGFFSEPKYVSLWAFLLSLQLYVFLRRADQCFSFTRGPVQEVLFAPLVKKAEERGARFERGMTVERVERKPSGGWRVQWRRDGEDGASGHVEARDLVLAMDVTGANELVERSPDLKPVLGDLSCFEGRRATAVRLWWATSPPEQWGESGVYGGAATADNIFWLHRFQDEFIEWHRQTGGSICECHVYAPQRLHDLTDEVLLDRVERDVARTYPELAGKCVARAIVRNGPTHIDFPVGCAQAFPTVETCHDDLVLCGDWIDGGTPVLYMERACQTALVAANRILVKRGKEPTPVLDLDPPPPHMRVLQQLLRGIGRLWPTVWPTGRDKKKS